jgi:hypothetical protein
MARQTKSETKLSEAADKATALLQGLQSRLNREAAPETHEEGTEELDRQLRVIEAVADRILQSWERGDRRELGALENQVIERVAERILERMSKR